MAQPTTFVTRQGLAVRAEPGVEPLTRADAEAMVEALLVSWPEACRKRFHGTLLVLRAGPPPTSSEYVFGGIRWPSERVVVAADYDAARHALRAYLEQTCALEGIPMGLEREDSLVIALNAVRDSFEASRENLEEASRILDRHRGPTKP